MTKRDAKKMAEAYRQAAKLIECGKHQFSCLALQEVGGSCDPLRDLFAEDAIAYGKKHYGEENTAFLAWLSNFVADTSQEDARPYRIMALCMAAAVIDAGDLP